MLLTLGYGLIGIGPLVAFFVPLLANKSFIVLLTFLSAFYWLVVLFLTSALFRAFVPFHPSAASYLGVLLVCVLIEELARLGIWRAHLSIIAFLEQHALRLGHVLRRLDRMYLAMGWGLGHATVHALFFQASFLPLTVQGGTWYADSCPAMNVFLAGALLTLGFNFLLISIMVLALEGEVDASSSRGLYSAVGSQLPQQQPQQQQQQQQQQETDQSAVMNDDVHNRGQHLQRGEGGGVPHATEHHQLRSQSRERGGGPHAVEREWLQPLQGHFQLAEQTSEKLLAAQALEGQMLAFAKWFAEEFSSLQEFGPSTYSLAYEIGLNHFHKVEKETKEPPGPNDLSSCERCKYRQQLRDQLFRQERTRLQRGFLDSITCRIHGGPVGRRGLNHIKAYLRAKGQRIAWVLMGSHNLSQPAFGSERRRGCLTIRSFELSVLLTPSLERAYRAHRHCGFTCMQQQQQQQQGQQEQRRPPQRVEFWPLDVFARHHYHCPAKPIACADSPGPSEARTLEPFHKRMKAEEDAVQHVGADVLRMYVPLTFPLPAVPADAQSAPAE